MVSQRKSFKQLSNLLATLSHASQATNSPFADYSPLPKNNDWLGKISLFVALLSLIISTYFAYITYKLAVKADSNTSQLDAINRLVTAAQKEIANQNKLIEQQNMIVGQQNLQIRNLEQVLIELKSGNKLTASPLALIQAGNEFQYQSALTSPRQVVFNIHEIKLEYDYGPIKQYKHPISFKSIAKQLEFVEKLGIAVYQLKENLIIQADPSLRNEINNFVLYKEGVFSSLQNLQRDSLRPNDALRMDNFVRAADNIQANIQKKISESK